MLSIELNYGTPAHQASEIMFENNSEALQSLIYLRSQAPFVILRDEEKLVVEFKFSTLEWIDDDFANWVFDNIHCHSEIRKILEVAPGRAI